MGAVASALIFSQRALWSMKDAAFIFVNSLEKANRFYNSFAIAFGDGWQKDGTNPVNYYIH